MTIHSTSASGPAAPLRQLSMLDWCAANAAQFSAFNGAYSTGTAFALSCGGGPIKVRGLRGLARFSSYPRTLRCSLWAGGSRVADTTITVIAHGVYEAAFASPVTVSHDQGELQQLTVSVVDQSSSPQYIACGYPLNGAWLPSMPWADGAVLHQSWCLYTAGDDRPAIGNSQQMPIEPILERAQ